MHLSYSWKRYMEAVSVKLQLLSLKKSETKDFQFNVAFKAFLKKYFSRLNMDAFSLREECFCTLSVNTFNMNNIGEAKFIIVPQ